MSMLHSTYLYSTIHSILSILKSFSSYWSQGTFSFPWYKGKKLFLVLEDGLSSGQ